MLPCTVCAPLFGRREAPERSEQYLRGLLVQKCERRSAESGGIALPRRNTERTMIVVHPRLAASPGSILLPLLAALLLIAPALQAQVDLRPYVGYSLSSRSSYHDDVFIAGATLGVGLANRESVRVVFQPALEVQFATSQELQVDGNLVVELPGTGWISPFFGVGAALRIDESSVDPGLNFVSGMTLGPARVPRPFVQGRFSNGKRLRDIALLVGIDF